LPLFMHTIKIRVSIFLVVSILLTITTLTISIIFYKNTTSVIFSLSDKIVQTTTREVILNTTQYLNTPASITRMLARLVAKEDIVANHENLWACMWDLLHDTKQIASVYIGDKHGNFVQSRKFPELATRIADRTGQNPREIWHYRDENYNIIRTESKEKIYDPRERPWYKNTKNDPGTGVDSNRNTVFLTDTYIFYTTKSPGITASYPVTDNHGTVNAVVGTDIYLDQLSLFMADQEVSPNGIVFIMDSNNTIVAYPDIRKTVRIDKNSGLRSASIKDIEEKWVTDAVRLYNKTLQKKLISVTDGKRHIASFADFPESFGKDWKIVIIIPEDDLVGHLQRMTTITLSISLFIIILSIFIMNSISNKLSRPILKLSDEMELIKDFNLDDVRGVKSIYKEINIMNDSLLTMKQGLQAFKKYVPSELVRQLIQAGEGAHLGGKSDELTIFFSDIADFTSIAENLPAGELMLYLSEYMNELTVLIMNEKGTIDKYIGDAIMAFWGAPVVLENHSYHACKAAIACQKKIRVLNDKWDREGKPVMKTRIGIHTGNVIVGNMGSDERLNYTIIGDNVNLCSRIEGINKEYKTEILITESAYQNVSQFFYCRPVDIVAVKGKTRGVKIYELLAEKSDQNTLLSQVCSKFTLAFELYQKKEFTKASEIYSEIFKSDNNDLTAGYLADRCEEIIRNGLSEQWSGINVLSFK